MTCVPDNNIATKEEIQLKLKCQLNALNFSSQAIPKEWRAKIRGCQHRFKEILPMYIRMNNMTKVISNIQSKNRLKKKWQWL